jgi:hypothetical protein
MSDFTLFLGKFLNRPKALDPGPDQLPEKRRGALFDPKFETMS